MDQNIHTFLVELLHDAGQTNLDKELEEVLIHDLETRLEDRLVLVSAQYLTPEQQEEVKKIENPDEVMHYLKNTVPDFENIVAEAMVDFREVYIAASKAE
mgnify:CR=1 FL=1